jgi:hypothetical protein
MSDWESSHERQRFRTISVTLAAGVAAPIIPLNANRRTLFLSVNGVNTAAFKFGSAPTSATDGICLDGASVSGGQVGSLLLDQALDSILTLSPADAVYAYSALGTTVVCNEGTVYEFI